MTEPDELTPAQKAAAAECAAIRDALFVLGRAAATTELAEFTGLDLQVVSRRLISSGPGQHLPLYRVFDRDRDTGLWTLTAVGRRLAEQANK